MEDCTCFQILCFVGSKPFPIVVVTEFVKKTDDRLHDREHWGERWIAETRQSASHNAVHEKGSSAGDADVNE